MGQIKDLQDGFKSSQGLRLAGLKVGLGFLDLVLELRRLGGERVLVHATGQIGVEQTLLHGLQIDQASAQGLEALLPQPHPIAQRRDEVVPAPFTIVFVFDAKRPQVGQDGLLELLLPPANDGMVLVGMHVAAPVVDVLVDVAVLLLTDDPFAGDAEAAMGADEDAARQVVVDLVGASVLALEQALAVFERRLVDQRFMLADVQLATEPDQAGVEWVVKNVADRRAMETRLALAIDVPFLLKDVADLLERLGPGDVQPEDASNRLGVHGMELDDVLVLAGDVHIPKRRQPRCPALAHLLLDALEHFGSQVIRVVLRHGGHDVERQRTGGTRPEVVLDEGEFDPAGVLEFLQPDRIPDVATGTVELVCQDVVDVLLARVGLDPLEHLVEHTAFRAALGRLGDDEFADDGPARLRRLLAHRTDLRVDGITLALFT